MNYFKVADTTLQLEPFEVRLTAIRYGACDVLLYEFSSIDSAALPGAEPGAHIDLLVPNGLTRQYSLINSGANPQSYLVGIKRDPQSRGGSQFIHDSSRVGQKFKIAGPRNNFPLAEEAASTVFIAGGIGITPIWCMAQHPPGLR